MLSPAVLFTAITIACFMSQIDCDPAPVQDIDIQSILELMQQQNANNGREFNVVNDQYESDSDEEDRKHYGSLKSQEILELVQKASQDSLWQGSRNDVIDSIKLNKVSSKKHTNSEDEDKVRNFLKELSENNLIDALLNDDQSSAKRYRNTDAADKLRYFSKKLSENNLDDRWPYDYQLSAQKYENRADTNKPRYFYKELSENNINDGLLYDYQPSAQKQRHTDNADSPRYFYKELSDKNLNNGFLYDYPSSAKKRQEYKDDDERHEHNRFNEEALQKLLTENVLDKKSQGKPKYKLVPNTLVGSTELKYARTQDRDNLGAYSKVYVVLNPKAIAKTGNKKKLNALLSKILSLTSSPLGSDPEKNTSENALNSFPVLHSVLSRRNRRIDSDDSKEEEYKPKPKRPRSDRGGGGGGAAAGRTAIPYIRHRGDIYERDD